MTVPIGTCPLTDGNQVPTKGKNVQKKNPTYNPPAEDVEKRKDSDKVAIDDMLISEEAQTGQSL